MEMHERIKELRRNHLHLSQTDFGNRLGVSRSVINNIERNVLARPEQKLSLIKLICKEFSVNEDWLLNGNEPMFIEPDTFSLDEFAKQHGATEIDLQIMKTYFELPPDVRSLLIDRFKNIFAITPAEQTEVPTHEMTVEEAEALYIKSRSKNAQKQEPPASSTTDGAEENKEIS